MCNQVRYIVGVEHTLLALESPRGRPLAKGLIWVDLHGKVLRFQSVLHAFGLINTVSGQAKRSGGRRTGDETVDEALGMVGGVEHRLAAGARNDRLRGSGGRHVTKRHSSVYLVVLLTITVVLVQEIMSDLRARAVVGVSASLLHREAFQQVLAAAAAVFSLGVVALL